MKRFFDYAGLDFEDLGAGYEVLFVPFLQCVEKLTQRGAGLQKVDDFLGVQNAGVQQNFVHARHFGEVVVHDVQGLPAHKLMDFEPLTGKWEK